MWYDEFKDLPKGWNSYGAAQISPVAIEVARVITEQKPQIVPTSPGGVQLEWHLKDWDIEIEINPDGTIEAFVERV